MKKITSILLSIAMLLTMAVMFTGCGGPSEDAIYPKSVEVEGTNGHGTISEYLNKDIVMEKKNTAEDAGNRELYEHYKGLKNIYGNCRMTVVDGKNGSLSNGDVVTLKITSTQYNEKNLEELGFTEDEISFEEFKYKVSGLKDPIEVEAKKEDIEISYSGFNGKGIINVSNKNTESIVYYSSSKTSELSNGDKITITPTVSDTNDTYVLKNKDAKFEFTVSGLPEFPDTLDGIDTSEVDTLMDAYVANEGVNEQYVGGNIDYNCIDADNKDDYSLDQIPITDVNVGEFVKNSTKYYKFKHDNRAIYSKSLTVNYTAEADHNTIYAKKGDVVKGSEKVIVYANVVVVDGKLHLLNPKFGNSEDTVGNGEVYLDSYRNKNGNIIAFGDFDNVIDDFSDYAGNKADDLYNKFIQEKDIETTSLY